MAEQADATPPGDLEAEWLALQSAAGVRRDPVQFHFLSVLVRRAESASGALQVELRERALRAVREYWHRNGPVSDQSIDRTLSSASKQSKPPEPVSQAGLPAVNGVFKAGAAVSQLAPHMTERAEAPETLAALVMRMSHHSDAPQCSRSEMDLAVPAEKAARPVDRGPDELRAMSQFRGEWSKLNVNRQLSQSMARAPGNAGPLNSDRLVVRALQAMRDASPAYLAQFMAYVDTLACLEQSAAGTESAVRLAQPEGERRRKAARGR